MLVWLTLKLLFRLWSSLGRAVSRRKLFYDSSALESIHHNGYDQPITCKAVHLHCDDPDLEEMLRNILRALRSKLIRQ